MAKINLNLLLASKNLSQQEFSKITNINKGTINRYCNNNCEKITLEHIDIICNYFKCTPNDLFTISHMTTVDEALETVKKMSEVYGHNVNATKDDEINSNNIQSPITQKLYDRIDTFLNDLLSYISNNKKDLSESEKEFLNSYDKYNLVPELQIRVGMKLEKYYDYLRILLADNINHNTNNDNNTLITLGILTEFRNLHYHGGLSIFQDTKTILDLQNRLDLHHKRFVNNEIHFLD